ncbi:type I restriction endonuclease subunit R [Ileibacterium valens]|uniref:type I restriction endonuclease subunit R n=1 Tax=Ileibacterium valens TaxID=1862668 RepID=UPI000A92683C|nr:type I restriction endonuclease subunit R [Ileibacterium valens]
MTGIDLIAATSDNTVVSEYTPLKRRSDAYQSEADLEKEFIQMLCEQGYEYLPVHKETELESNLRFQLEKLNDITFSDNEWKRFFNENLANPNEHIVEKTRKIQEDYVQVLKRDDGSSKNIKLIDKDYIHHNILQVINQYEVSKAEGVRHNNRYDVTVLVNGLPMVHIELKRRGVAIREAFNQIDRYQRDSFWAGNGLFEYIQIFVISNGTETKYYSNTTRFNAEREHERAGGSRKKTSNSFEFTSYWSDANNRIIPDLVDFTRTFFARHTLLNILTKYCIFTAEDMLMVMRPYQITATERILNRIAIVENYKYYGSVKGGGYIWHTTGSGKTLTSFKTARLASSLPYIDKVLFVVDRKDLDYQTMKEYDRFEKGAANSNTSTKVLTKQLSDPNAKIIITTIQKLSTFIKKNPKHPVFDQKVVMIFDECHRSQFGDMHRAVIKNFKKYEMFGFTGTPIFADNATKAGKNGFFTTAQTFGDQLHTYTIVDAIRDKNVLPFRVDYIKTIDSEKQEEDDELIYSIDREKIMMAPERISMVTKYILEHFDQKTYRNSRVYSFNKLSNVAEVASGKQGAVEEIKSKQRLSGFNSILAVSSVEAAKAYYQEFKKQMKADPSKKLRIATIYSYGANEAEPDGILEDENSEDTTRLDQTSRDFLESAIEDYNKVFGTNYSTGSDKFQNYYKDVSLRMKNKEIDLLIVVGMFLTGFDATTLNTLWVDKNLKMHGLIQAFSRTNRILNSVKTFGNVVCFRPLKKQVDQAISLFGDKDAGGIVLLHKFSDYYNGFEARVNISQVM